MSQETQRISIPHSPFAIPHFNKRPRQESNLALDLRRVVCAPIHFEDVTCFQRPTEESNLALQFRGLPCDPTHSLGVSIPTWNRTRTWTFGGSDAIRYTIGT